MRLVTAFLLAAICMTGTALAQASDTSNYTPTALQPNNCGTPDTPKPCAGAKGMPKHHAAYKVPKQQ
jgi:hypothetical protein